MGTIYKRGRVYWIKYYRSGKPYYESTRGEKEPIGVSILHSPLKSIKNEDLTLLVFLTHHSSNVL